MSSFLPHTFVAQLFLGFSAPLTGLTMIAGSNAIRRLAVLPFILTLFIFLIGLALGLPFITGLVMPFTTWLIEFFGMKPKESLAQTLSWVLPILIWPALAVALLYLLVVATRLFVAPFYALLAEKTLIQKGAIEPGKFQLIPWFQINARMTGVSLVKAGVFAVLGLVLTVLSFIPGVGLVTGLGFLTLVAYDISDYAMEAYGWSFRDRIAFFKNFFPAFLGLGIALGLVFLIPGLNFFLLPASVVGAAELVRRLNV